MTALLPFILLAIDAADTAALQALKQEVAQKGWITYTAQAPNGSKDLFVTRPDGSDAKNITNTVEFDEAAGRWSNDGRQLLYRRMKRGTVIAHDHYGEQGELVIADADGTNPKALGGPGQFAYASWDPTGKRLACLGGGSISIVEIETKNTLKTLPAKGIHQRLFWSPDGKWIVGTANVSGIDWCIVRMDVETGQVNLIAKFRCCTPDWFPDSQRIIYSSRPGNQKGYGWTQLWMADADGKNQRLICGEDGRHLYYGCPSPDAKYVVYVGSPQDGGGAEKAGAPMWVMRLADTPAVAGPSPDLRKVHPNAKDALRLRLGVAWDPHWTYADIWKKDP